MEVSLKPFMWLYLACVVFGLALPTALRSVLARLTRAPSSELYDQADAVTLNLPSRSNPTLWFNMGWWEHE